MKFLIIGLGNPGETYQHTRHNIGFMVLDALASSANASFGVERHAEKTEFRFAGRQFILIKPNTFMNLSGKAVRYWLQETKTPIEQILVITDDIALPFGKMRLRAKGSDGGHNGLKSIQEVLQTTNYPRLRMGIGDNFSKGKQADYVLGEFLPNEFSSLRIFVEQATDCITQFAVKGIAATMTQFNK